MKTPSKRWTTGILCARSGTSRGTTGIAGASRRPASLRVCKQDPDSSDCKSPLSPLDTSFDNWRFAESREGGYISEGLQNTLDHGVCRNERAFYPTDPQEHQIVDHINEYFKTLRDSSEEVEQSDWKNFTMLSYDPRTRSFGSHPITLDNELLEAVRTVHHQSQSWWRVWQWPLRFSSSDNPLGSTLSATMSTLSWATSGTSRALRDTLVGSECTSNRVKAPFENLGHAETTFRFWQSRPERLAAIKEAVSYGNSVGVGMCVGNQIERPGCFPHAIVMDALRYDRPNDKWEGHFINSWGEDSKVMNSWKDLGDVVDDFLVINHYVPKTSDE